jgi:hypothetical protein
VEELKTRASSSVIRVKARAADGMQTWLISSQSGSAKLLTKKFLIEL